MKEIRDMNAMELSVRLRRYQKRCEARLDRHKKLGWQVLAQFVLVVLIWLTDSYLQAALFGALVVFAVYYWRGTIKVGRERVTDMREVDKIEVRVVELSIEAIKLDEPLRMMDD